MLWQLKRVGESVGSVTMGTFEVEILLAVCIFDIDGSLKTS